MKEMSKEESDAFYEIVRTKYRRPASHRIAPSWVVVAFLIALVLGVALGSAHAADANTISLSDFGSVAETANDIASEYTIGTNGQTGVPLYVMIDGRGLGPTALQHLTDAMACTFTSFPTQIDRLVCRIGRWAAGPGWVQARDSSARWVAYVIVDRDDLPAVRWFDAQFASVHVVAGNWAAVKVLPACTLFYGATACAASSPPAVFAGVSP